MSEFDERRIEERVSRGDSRFDACGHMLVLDSQAAGALLCRRLCRCRSMRLRRAQTAALGVDIACSKSAEYHFYGALSRAALLRAARRQTSAAASGGIWPPITDSSRSGRRIARRISRTAPRWSAPRLLASKAASSMPMRLYEQAIRSARANGFVHNEALAYELAARFYAARGFEKIAHVYLRNARYGYLRWGADGKVRQLDELYPHLGRRSAAPGSDEHDRGAGRTPRPRDRDQGVAGRLGRDRAGETDRHAHAHGDRAGGRRARLVDSSARRPSSGSRRKPRPAAIR